MSEQIKVGMADVKVCSSPDSLITLGLGSCVGIAVRDPDTKIGGLAHIMLPDSTAIKDSTNKYKFADTGIDELISMLEAKGASRKRLIAKLAGGAQMFAFQNKSELGRIGERNVEACHEKLKQLGISVIAEDVGENYGRTVVFYPETGDYEIRAVGRGNKVI